MKKLLLILGLALLLAATAVSAQEWATRVIQVYQCSGGTPMSTWPTIYGGPNYDCSDVRAALDPYDPKPGYPLTESYLQSNNMLGSAYKIVQCGIKIRTGKTPNEWGWITYHLNACPAGWMDSTQGILYSLKQQAPGTKEVFLCSNNPSLNYNTQPFVVYSLSTDPGCRSSNRDRAGYTRVTSLGFWPQSTDFKLPPPPSPEVCCMLTNDRGDRKANVMQKTQCETEAQKGKMTFTTAAKEECDKEVCCTYEGRYEFTRNSRCYERKGTVLDKTKEQCREPEPVCGNGLVERGEDCEPPGTATCDARCRTIAPPPAVCPVTRAENDALLATLSQLEKERDSYAKKEVCCAIENDRGDRKVDRTTLEKCNKNLQEKGIKLIRLAPPDMCEAKVCCMLGTNAKTASFRECIQNKGAEVEGAKCAAPPTPVCGNGIKETGEACEANKDCGEGMLCNNCQCAKISVALPPTGTPLTDDQVWHVYQCIGSVYIKSQNIGPYATTMTGPPGCGSYAATVDHDLGYILKQFRTGIGTIRYCQHQYGTYLDGVTTETDIKFNANCDYDDRQLATTQTIGPNAVTPSIMGYAFTTQQPGTKPMYKCVKSGTPLRYNFKVSSSANCNAGQSGWDGYSNAGTLGYWLTQPILPMPTGN